MDRSGTRNHRRIFEPLASALQLAVSWARYQFRRRIARYPSVFYPLYGLAQHNKRLMLTAGTQLVIEGFPRCANTFAVLAFESVQKKPIKLAHHLHAQAQIALAAKRGIPICVLIRDPIAASKSLHIREPHISVNLALRTYIEFYRDIYPLCDKFVVASFEDVTKDFGSVIQRINEKFQTEFDIFVYSPSSIETVFGQIERLEEHHNASRKESVVARPSATRQEYSDHMCLPGSSEALILAARSWYETYVRLGAASPKKRPGLGSDL